MGGGGEKRRVDVPAQVCELFVDSLQRHSDCMCGLSEGWRGLEGGSGGGVRGREVRGLLGVEGVVKRGSKVLSVGGLEKTKTTRERLWRHHQAASRMGRGNERRRTYVQGAGRA
jgi:hypothetical protein